MSGSIDRCPGMLDQCLLTAHEALVLHGYGFVPRKSKPKVEDSVLLSSYNIYMRNLIITTKKEDEALFTSPEDTYPKILRREFLSCWNNVVGTYSLNSLFSDEGC